MPQGPTLLHSFDCGSYVGMATSMVLGAMVRSDSSSPYVGTCTRAIAEIRRHLLGTFVTNSYAQLWYSWEFHALEMACFGNEGTSSKRRQWESICGEWLEDV